MNYLTAKLGEKPAAQKRRQLLDQSVNSIVAAADPSQIFVFGSILSESFTYASDIDLAVIFDDEQQSIQGLKRQIYKATGALEFPVDLLFFSAKEFEEKSRVGGVCMEIVKRGQLIYDKRSAV